MQQQQGRSSEERDALDRADLIEGSRGTIEERDDSFCLEPGMMTVSIAAIDVAESKGVEGYVPVTGVLWSWMSIAPPAYEHGYRYLLATARRLDAARTLLDQVRDLLDQEPPSVGPALRSHLWRTVSTVEVAVVAFGRALDMSVR